MRGEKFGGKWRIQAKLKNGLAAETGGAKAAANGDADKPKQP